MTFTAAHKKIAYDIAERVVVTFLQTFGALLIADNWFTVDAVTDLSIVQQAAIGGLGAVLSLIKGLIATQLGANTAALLPKKLDTPKPQA